MLRALPARQSAAMEERGQAGGVHGGLEGGVGRIPGSLQTSRHAGLENLPGIFKYTKITQPS